MIPTPTLFLPSTFVCAQGAGRLPGVPADPPAQIGAANATPWADWCAAPLPPGGWPLRRHNAAQCGSEVQLFAACFRLAQNLPAVPVLGCQDAEVGQLPTCCPLYCQFQLL